MAVTDATEASHVVSRVATIAAMVFTAQVETSATVADVDVVVVVVVVEVAERWSA